MHEHTGCREVAYLRVSGPAQSVTQIHNYDAHVRILVLVMPYGFLYLHSCVVHELALLSRRAALIT
jgi:hypothetical protein